MAIDIAEPRIPMAGARQEDASREEPLDKQVEHILEEARTVLPGIQALFGFQLIAVFNQSFAQKLDHGEQCIHLAALGLTAFATALVMTPAAYHRQVEPGRVSGTLVRLGTRCLGAAMLPLSLGITVDFYLIARIIVGSPRLSAALAAVVGLAFAGFWFGLPWTMRAARARP